MMRLDCIVDFIIGKIKGDSYFDDVKIIKAYPNSFKPTRLRSVIVAVGIGEISLEAKHIDSDVKGGKASVFADIFVPLSMKESDICNIFSRLCSAVDCCCITEISTSGIVIDNEIQAKKLKTVITIYDEISFGGDADE